MNLAHIVKRKIPSRPLRSKHKEPAAPRESHPMFAPDEGDMALIAPTAQRIQSLRKGSYGPAKITPAPKSERASDGTKAAQAHKDALAQLGCMVCRRLFPFLAPGPVELHHLRGGGWGRGDYMTLIPLCVEHHKGDSGVHGLGTKGFVKRYGFTQADLLMDAMTLLRAGKKLP